MFTFTLYAVALVLALWASSHVLNSATVLKIPSMCGAIVIESDFVPFPAALAALTVKSNAPAAVGIPEMVFPESVKPPGKSPLSTLHVMGAVPVAASVWLYAVPTSPSGNDAVVIAGAVPVVLSSPESLQAVIPNTSAIASTANKILFFILSS
jgi:hypothetical protein